MYLPFIFVFGKRGRKEKKMANNNKYYSQIYYNNNLQYRAAQSYYKKLKDNMIDIIETNFKKQLGHEIKQAGENYSQVILDVLLGKQGVTRYEDSKNNSNVLLEQTMKKAVANANMVNGNMRQYLTEIFQEVKNDMADYGKKHGDIQNYTRAFLGRVETKLKKIGHEGWLASQKDTIYNELLQSGHSTEVAAQLSSYYLRIFLNTIHEDTVKVGHDKYLQALRGYHLEAATTEAINNAMDQLITKFEEGSNQPKTQDYKIAINIGGKNTVNDIQFDLSFGLPDGTKITAEGLSNLSISEEDIQKLITENGISYGAQIKSWMPKSSGEGWMSPVLPVGYRAQLYSNFIAANDKYPNQQMTAGMVFLGLENNIKDALGRNNVMFIDGKNHYWMDDFINSFRRAKYYLSFDYKNKKPTQEVILYQWYKYHKDKHKK